MKNTLFALFVLPLFCYSQVDSSYINLLDYQESSTQQIDLMLGNLDNYHRKTREGQLLQMLGAAGTLMSVNMRLNATNNLDVSTPSSIEDYDNKIKTSDNISIISGSFILLGGIMQYSAQKWFSKRFMKVKNKNISTRVEDINPTIPSNIINKKNDKLILDTNLMERLSNLEKGKEYYIQTQTGEYNAKLIGNARQMLQVRYKENGKKTIKIIHYSDVVTVTDL
jgi:hypothetical protein